MDSTTVLPSGYSGILDKTFDSNARCHDNGAARDILREVSDTGQHIHNNIADGHRAILREVSDSTRLGMKETADASRVVGKEVCDTSHDVIQEITRQGGEARASSERLALHGYSAQERFGLRNGDLTDSWGFRNHKATDDSSFKAQISFKEQLLELEKAKQVLERQASDYKASIERHAAESACQIKELILSQGHETRALIQRVEVDALKEKLAQRERELLAVRLNPAVVAPV
jgi:hypothetical protein